MMYPRPLVARQKGLQLDRFRLLTDEGSSNETGDNTPERKLSDQKELDNQRNSPLLGLPGELRNRIYDYLIADCTLYVKCRYPNILSLVYDRSYRAPQQVSRQIRRELRPYILDHCRYFIHWRLGGVERDGLECFQRLGISRIQDLTVNVTVEYTRGVKRDAKLVSKYLEPICTRYGMKHVVIRAEFDRVGTDLEDDEFMEPRKIVDLLGGVLHLESGGREIEVKLEADEWDYIREYYRKDMTKEELEAREGKKELEKDVADGMDKSDEAD